MLHTLIYAAFIGIGATLILDAWALFLQRCFGIAAMNWAMVGRWIGHMAHGQWIQKQLNQTPAIRCEHAIGWGFHYLIGIGYGLLLMAIGGVEWLHAPTITAPLTLSLALLVLPYFVMMPGMGMGIAASRTAKPNTARFKSIVGHSVFGIGMYMTGLLLCYGLSIT